jgi:hypothetical protein
MQSNIGSVFWALAGAVGGLVIAVVFYGAAIGLFDTVMAGKAVSNVYAQSLGAKTALVALGFGIPIGSVGAIVLLEKTAGIGRVALGLVVALALSAIAIYAFFNGGGLKLLQQYSIVLIFGTMAFVAILGFAGRTMKSAAA